MAKSNLTVDDYLAKVPEDKRSALEKLRKTIKAAALEAIEIISYQIPTFRYQRLSARRHRGGQESLHVLPNEQPHHEHLQGRTQRI